MTFTARTRDCSKREFLSPFDLESRVWVKRPAMETWQIVPFSTRVVGSSDGANHRFTRFLFGSPLPSPPGEIKP